MTRSEAWEASKYTGLKDRDEHTGVLLRKTYLSGDDMTASLITQPMKESRRGLTLRAMKTLLRRMERLLRG